MVYLEIWNEEISIFKKFGNNDKIKCNISSNACKKKKHSTVSVNRMKLTYSWPSLNFYYQLVKTKNGPVTKYETITF